MRNIRRKTKTVPARARLLQIGILLIALPFVLSSCSDDSGIATQTSGGDYCYVKSVVLGAVKRKLEVRDRRGNIISSTQVTYSASAFEMTVNQRTGLIENRDSLPCGTMLDRAIATITFDGTMLAYRVKGTDSGWTAYNSTDSLDLTRPLELYLTSNDGESSRIYTLQVNVHQQEGDSLYWNRCEQDVEALTGLTDMKAFVLSEKLLVLGRNEGETILAKRSGINAQGTWTKEQVTSLPATADLQSLRQQAGMLFLSTEDGNILTSSDAHDWQQVGTTHSAPLTLVEKTADFFYALSEGKLLRSADATTWEEEPLDADASLLPTTDIRALTFGQNDTSRRIVMVGHQETGTNACVWNKTWNGSEPEAEARWIYFPVSPDNTVPCPRLANLNLLPYDGKCIAFGGESADGRHKALDAVFISQDYGITWRPSTLLHLPIDLEGTESTTASAVDENNFIWIITNAQVWRGRLNRLGFAQQ